MRCSDPVANALEFCESVVVRQSFHPAAPVDLGHSQPGYVSYFTWSVGSLGIGAAPPCLIAIGGFIFEDCLSNSHAVNPRRALSERKLSMQAGDFRAASVTA